MTYTVNDSFLGGNDQVVYSISGNILTITPGSNPQVGSGTVTVLAKDPDGLGGVQRFSLHVQLTVNNAPTASGTIPDSTKKVGHSAYSVDLSGYFTDEDGDTLTYTAISLRYHQSHREPLRRNAYRHPRGSGNTNNNRNGD